MNEIVILGAGGHAKVVISTARACGIGVAGILDDDPRKVGTTLFRSPVFSTLDDLHCYTGWTCIIAIGDNGSRSRMYEAWRWRRINWCSLVHPTAFVEPSAACGQGTVVFAGATVQVDARIGDHCIINTQASVDHDCVLGNFVHVAPGCHLAGNVTVKEGAFLGIGSSVIPGVTIGRDAVVGAGAVVVKDVPDGATVVGVPARILRTASDEAASE